MPNNSQRINSLFQLYLTNSISAEEYQEFIALLNINGSEGALTSGLRELWIQSGKAPIALPDEEWDNKIQFLIQKLEKPDAAVSPAMDRKDDVTAAIRRLSGRYTTGWAAAAIFLIISSSAIYYMAKAHKNVATLKVTLAKNSNVDITPGSNKAVLTLADGTSIVLDSATNGTIARQGASRVIKLNTGQLVYNASGTGQNPVSYNTLSTPRGGQYQVTLSDGTIVWLNSKSSLRYPTAFTGADRKVEITGEAYFEVAKNPLRPFKVKINISTGDGGEVEVLGTHFNINAYEGEASVRTTLLEGSVQLNQLTGTTRLKAGQQLQSGRLAQNSIVNDANLEAAVAWKEGRFQFESADINSVMRQLANWYDVEVAYKGAISHHFEGTISRNVNLLKVLNMLQLTGEVQFKVEGRKIIVAP